MTSQAVATPQPGTATLPDEDMPPEFSLDINSILALLAEDDALDEWLLRFNADNEDSGYQFEIDRRGRLLAMASEGRDGSERQFNLQFDLQIWTSTGPAERW